MAEDLPTPIDGEVQSQLERLRQQQTANERDIWTLEDQTKLEQELAQITPNPLYVNEDFPDIEVALGGGQKTMVHDVNNFPMILAAIDTLRRGEVPEDVFSRMFAHLASERKYVEIFETLEARFPAGYKRIRLLEAARMKKDSAELQKTKEELDEERYQRSQIYTAAADIARELDPNYNLALLTRT
ncbi:MAG TPA: hypothetical protein VFT49_03105 [Candidatus Saccharimonadales bacterium]|nr:hypothetical protein [Candidatus Saccharimonadales bacterium]